MSKENYLLDTFCSEKKRDYHNSRAYDIARLMFFGASTEQCCNINVQTGITIILQICTGGPLWEHYMLSTPIASEKKGFDDVSESDVTFVQYKTWKHRLVQKIEKAGKKNIDNEKADIIV